MRRAFATTLVIVVLAVVGPVGAADSVNAVDAPAGEVRVVDGRATIRVTDEPLYRLLARLATESGGTLRGMAPQRSVTVEILDVPLRQALATVLGSESFMLTYAADGSLRTINLLAAGVPSSPSPRTSPSPRPPLAEEEEQAAILQRTVTVSKPLARAVGSEKPAIGRLLHAAVQEPRASLRAEARDAVLAAFAEDPEAEAAYLSTLTPVADDVLARILRGSSAATGGGAEEWMAALATRAASAELRAKATSVLAALRQLPK